MTGDPRYRRLFIIECRALVRAVMPSRATRLIAGFAAVVWVAVSAFAGVLIGLRSGRAFSADALVTLIVGFAAVALGVAITSSVRLLRRPDLTALWRLAPIAPSFVTLLPLMVMVTLAALGIVVLGAPLFFIVLAADPMAFAALTAAALVVATWATLVTLAAVSFLSATKGPDKAAHTAQLLVTPVVILFMFLMRWSSTQRGFIDGPVLLIGVLLSAAFLPLAIRNVSAWWLRGLVAVGSLKRSAPVSWGRVNWRRMVMRTPAPLALLATIPLTVFASTKSATPLAVVLVSVPMVLLFHLTRWEDLCPERQLLAPRAAAMRADLFRSVGVPATAVCCAIALAFSVTQPRMALLAVGIVAGATSFFIRSARARAAVQFAVIGFGAVVGATLP